MKLVFPNGEHAQVLLSHGVNRIGSGAEGAVVLSEPGVAGGDVDKDGLDGSAGDVLESRRVHEQLPVVLMGGKIERHLVGACVPYC